MADFNGIVEWVLREEDATLKGVIKNLGDGAGLTRFGITQKNNPDVDPTFWTTMPVQRAFDVAKSVYHNSYWMPIRGDQIVSDQIAAPLFSFYVNEGSFAIRELQPIVGADADGRMGPATVAAINASIPNVVAKAYRMRQEQYYRDLAKTRTDIAKDLNGLLARCWKPYP